MPFGRRGEDEVANRAVPEVVLPEVVGSTRSGSYRSRSGRDPGTERTSHRESVSGERSGAGYSEKRRSESRGTHSKKRNQSTEIFKVVFGGILALPIAYLLVLWVFRQDPLSFGPPLSKVIPFVVPEELREFAVEEDVIDDDEKSDPADDKDDDLESKDIESDPAYNEDEDRDPLDFLSESVDDVVGELGL